MPDFQLMRESLGDIKIERLTQAVDSQPTEYWNSRIRALRVSTQHTLEFQILIVLIAIGVAGYLWPIPDRTSRFSIVYLTLIPGVIGWFWAKAIRERNRQETAIIASLINCEDHVVDTIRWLGNEGADRRSRYGGMIISQLYGNPPLLGLILHYIAGRVDGVSEASIRKYGPQLKPVLDRVLSETVQETAHTLGIKLLAKGVNTKNWLSSSPNNTA